MLLLCATVFVTSCSKNGSDGKNGTDGTNGTNGTNGKTALTKTTKEPAGANCKYGGTKFETGIDANNNGILDSSEVTTTQTKYVCDGAGALYSSWIKVNVSDTFKNVLYEEQYYPYKQPLTVPALTADIVNKGIVLMYYKNKNGIIFPVSNNYSIRDVDSSGYNFTIQATFLYKEKYLSFLSNGYMDGMNNNGSAIRYVLIPGVGSARREDLIKMPYGELAKLYNIEN